MKCIGLICNSGLKESGTHAEEIACYLKERGVICIVSDDGAGITKECECVIVLGGDGTLLHAAKTVLSMQIPLLGVNLGALGYLTEVDLNGIRPALDKLLADDYTIERRMMLEGRVIRNGREILRDTALNDIYIKGIGAMRTYRFRNYVNDEYLNQVSADGMILSTATGSTGYNLSVGGPIVSPQAEAILMTPIAPHSLVASRTIIFSGSDRISVKIEEGRTGSEDSVAFVRYDGAGGVRLNTGDLVTVSRSGKYTGLVKINHISFLEVLRKKMAES